MIFYYPACFWFAMMLTNIFICYRYYFLAKTEEKTCSQIKIAFGEKPMYINKGHIVELDHESEADFCVDLGDYMLSSSKINKQGFLLAAIGAFLTAIAAVASIN
jgi:hypothetical protein